MSAAFAPTAVGRTPTPVDAAAIVMLVLSDDDAAALLARLDAEAVRRLIGAVDTLRYAGDRDIAIALGQFSHKVKSLGTLGIDAPERMDGVMRRALGPERADAIRAQLPQRAKPALPKTSPVDMLRWLPADQITRRLRDEHPQMIAVVCGLIAPATAAQVIAALPETAQDDVLHRVATAGPVSDRALDAIARLFARNDAEDTAAPATTAAAPNPDAQLSRLTDIVGAAPDGADRRWLASLTARDAKLGDALDALLFRFTDLAGLSDRDLASLLRVVEQTVLVPALKGADDALRNRMLGVLPQRAAQTIEDALADSPPLLRTDVLLAQRQVVAAARKLADAGTIQLRQGSDDYV